MKAPAFKTNSTFGTLAHEYVYLLKGQYSIREIQLATGRLGPQGSMIFRSHDDLRNENAVQRITLNDTTVGRRVYNPGVQT